MINCFIKVLFQYHVSLYIIYVCAPNYDVKLVKKSLKATRSETEWGQPCSVSQILSQIKYIWPGWSKMATKCNPDRSKVTTRPGTRLWWASFPSQGGHSRVHRQIPDFPWEAAIHLLKWGLCVPPFADIPPHRDHHHPDICILATLLQECGGASACITSLESTPWPDLFPPSLHLNPLVPLP